MSSSDGEVNNSVSCCSRSTILITSGFGRHTLMWNFLESRCARYASWNCGHSHMQRTSHGATGFETGRIASVSSRPSRRKSCVRQRADASSRTGTIGGNFPRSLAGRRLYQCCGYRRKEHRTPRSNDLGFVHECRPGRGVDARERLEGLMRRGATCAGQDFGRTCIRPKVTARLGTKA